MLLVDVDVKEMSSVSYRKNTGLGIYIIEMSLVGYMKNVSLGIYIIDPVSIIIRK